MTDSIQLMAMLGAYKSHEELHDKDRFTAPSRIESLFDLHKIKFKYPKREENAADKIYLYAKSVINGFKVSVSSALQDATALLESLTDIKLNSELERFREEYKQANREFVGVSNELLIKGVDPMIYFSVKKHILLANMFIKLTENTEKIHVSSIKETLSNIKQNNQLEIFELGYFVALEPIFVIGALNAIKWDDKSFITTYEALVDKYSRLTARRFPRLYLELSGLSKKEFDSIAFYKYADELETVRNA